MASAQSVNWGGVVASIVLTSGTVTPESAFETIAEAPFIALQTTPIAPIKIAITWAAAAVRTAVVFAAVLLGQGITR